MFMVHANISGHNREYEVGKHLRNDEIDERQYGTNLSM